MILQVRIQRHRLDAEKFPMLSGGWSYFVAIWIPVGLSSGLSRCDPVDLRTSFVTTSGTDV